MHDSDETACEAATRRALNHFAWIFGLGLALSLGMPEVFFAATISSFTAFAAGIVASIALFARDNLLAPHLSRWDVAAGLYAMSLFTGLFVDVEAISLHLMAGTAGR